MADGPVEVGRLQRALELDRAAIEEALARLAASNQARGVRLQRKGDSVALVSAPEAAPYVERFLGLGDSGRLSPPALETLAIVAYRQPVTRMQIEAIRGVGADYAIKTLLARSLSQDIGRRETVGRPVLFGTTFEFLQYFGLESLDQLPAMPEAFAELAEARERVAAEITERASPPAPRP